MQVWWLSWYDHGEGAFELHSPWWVSGYDADDNTIIVAAVRAENEEAAWGKIRLSYDNPPEGVHERFIEECKSDFVPFGGRFGKAAWMEWTDTATCACDLDTCDGKNL